jgi:hypothetical protein
MSRRSKASCAIPSADGNPKQSDAPQCACEYCQDLARYDVDAAEWLPLRASFFTDPSEEPIRLHRTRHPAGGVEVHLLCKDQALPQPQPAAAEGVQP